MVVAGGGDGNGVGAEGFFPLSRSFLSLFMVFFVSLLLLVFFFLSLILFLISSFHPLINQIYSLNSISIFFPFFFHHIWVPFSFSFFCFFFPCFFYFFFLFLAQSCSFLGSNSFFLFSLSLNIFSFYLGTPCFILPLLIGNNKTPGTFLDGIIMVIIFLGLSQPFITVAHFIQVCLCWHLHNNYVMV